MPILSEELVNMAAAVGIQLPSQLPLFSCPPNIERLTDWAESQSTPMLRQIAQKMVEHIHYISFEIFLEQLQQTVTLFNQKIKGKPYVLFITEARHKSDRWVPGLAFEHCGLQQPEAILEWATLDDYLKLHPEIQEILILDDCAYSGNQKCAVLRDLPVFDVDTNVYIGIPYMSRYAKDNISKTSLIDKIAVRHSREPSRNEHFHLHVLEHTEIPSVMDCLNEEEKYYAHTLDLPELKDSITLTYFDHRFPDDKSIVQSIWFGSPLMSSRQQKSLLKFAGFTCDPIVAKNHPSIQQITDVEEYNTIYSQLVSPNYGMDFRGYNIPFIFSPYWFGRSLDEYDSLKIAIQNQIVGIRTSFQSTDPTITGILETTNPLENSAASPNGYKKSQLPLKQQIGFDEAVITGNWKETTYQQQQNSEIPHLKASIEAAARVFSCHAYISIKPIDELMVKAQRQQLTDFFLRFGDRNDDHGTSARVHWNPSFEYLRAIHILPKDLNSKHEPKLVLLFSHYNQMKHKIFTCYRDYNVSLAKVILSISEDSYPGNTSGSVGINSINSQDVPNNSSNFRQGSFLIQLAIEYSFQQGYEGRASLFSTNQSGKFYFKLGFLPKHLTKSILKRFHADSDVDGHEMYLPQTSIDAWKERIVKFPIILSQQEIDRFITNHETARQPNLNIRLEAVLAGDGFHINSLVSLLNKGAEINAVSNGYKALHILIRHNFNRQNDEWIETLVKAHHADINIKDPINNRTPLHSLIHEQPNTSVDFFKWLVSLGADINTQDKDGQTLLQAAMHAKNNDVIQYLKHIGCSSSQDPASVVPPNRPNLDSSANADTGCFISMQVLSGFMVVLGVAAVAIAFTALNAATFGTVGFTVACIGLVSLLTGCGFFKEACGRSHTEVPSLPLFGPPI